MCEKHKGRAPNYMSMFDRWVKAGKPDDVKGFVAKNQTEVLSHIAQILNDDSDGSKDRDWQAESTRALRSATASIYEGMQVCNRPTC